MFKQRTLKTTVQTVGIGLHSGRKVRLVMRPAEPDTGILFTVPIDYTEGMGQQ